MARFSRGEAIRFGWEAMKRNLAFFIGLLLVVAVIAGAGNVLQHLAVKRGAAITLLVALLFTVINIIVQMGLIRISLRVHDGQAAGFNDLFSCTSLFFKYLFGSILYGLICMGGFLLLIVPGIIWGIKFSQYGYLIIDRGCGPIEALKRSALITNGEKWDLCVFSLAIAGINILGALCLLIGLFATIPTTMVAAAFVYRKLQDNTDRGFIPGFAAQGQ